MSRAVSNSDGSTWHRHSLLIGPQLDLTSSSNRLADAVPGIREISWFALTSFGFSFCRREKESKLRRQLGPAVSGASCGRGEQPDPAVIRCGFDEFEISGDHREQVVEVVRNTAGELSDGLHLLALVKLFLDQPSRLHRVLVLGDVSKVDRETLAGGERIDRVPDTAPSTIRFERNRTLVRHGFPKLAENFRVWIVQKGILQIRADQVTAFGDLRLGARIEEADALVSIDDDHAVGRTLKDSS